MKVDESKDKGSVWVKASNSKAGGDWLEISSADKETVDSKLNMRQQCTLMAVKVNSVLDRRSVARSSQRVIISFCFAFVQLHPRQCLALDAPSSN